MFQWLLDRLHSTRRGSGKPEYFLALRERYEVAAAASGYTPTPLLAEVFARVPPCPPGMTAAAYQRLLETTLSWADVFVVERAIVAALPAHDLIDALLQQRVRYAQIVPADEFTTYIRAALDLAPARASTDPAAPERIRAELGALTDRIIYVLITSGPKETVRGWLTVWTIVLMAAAMVAIFAVYVWAYTTTKTPHGAFRPTEALFVVLFCGLIGGFISVQQRLQAPTNVDPLYKRIEFEASGISILVSPVIGMVFAAVFFVLLLGGFVTGDLFPKFVCDPAEQCTGHNLASFAAGATPDSTASWAKLAIWAFAAGFLERLVPDILTRLATVSTTDKK